MSEAIYFLYPAMVFLGQTSRIEKYVSGAMVIDLWSHHRGTIQFRQCCLHFASVYNRGWSSSQWTGLGLLGAKCSILSTSKSSGLMDNAIIDDVINTADRCFIMGTVGSHQRMSLRVTAISSWFLALGWLMHYIKIRRHLRWSLVMQN